MLQGATGFGMAIICMALLPFFLPMDLTIIVVMWVGGFSAAVILWQIREHLDLKLILIPLCAVIISRFIGVTLVVGLMYTEIIKVILGIVLIILSVYLAFFNQKFKIKPSAVNGTIAGSMSGLLGGMFNISGPPMVVYMLGVTDNKMVYSACLQFAFCIGAFSNAVFFGLHGALIPEAGFLTLLLCVITGLVSSFIGARVGISLFKKMNRKLLFSTICCVMALSGIIYILQSTKILP
jgi:uncharacterized membrane protein YfcA